jgi:hypothetical protein
VRLEEMPQLSTQAVMLMAVFIIVPVVAGMRMGMVVCVFVLRIVVVAVPVWVIMFGLEIMVMFVRMGVLWIVRL